MRLGAGIMLLQGRSGLACRGRGGRGAQGAGALQAEAPEQEECQRQGQAAAAVQGGRPVHVAQVRVAAGHRPGLADAVHVRGHALDGTGLGHRGVPQERVHCGPCWVLVSSPASGPPHRAP